MAMLCAKPQEIRKQHFCLQDFDHVKNLGSFRVSARFFGNQAFGSKVRPDSSVYCLEHLFKSQRHEDVFGGSMVFLQD